MDSWVVYDVSYLYRFYDIIKQSIGNSINVGILVFAAVFAWLLVSRIVKKFSK